MRFSVGLGLDKISQENGRIEYTHVGTFEDTFKTLTLIPTPMAMAAIARTTNEIETQTTFLEKPHILDLMGESFSIPSLIISTPVMAFGGDEWWCISSAVPKVTCFSY